MQNVCKHSQCRKVQACFGFLGVCKRMQKHAVARVSTESCHAADVSAYVSAYARCFWAHDGDSMQFYTSYGEKLRIKSTGEVGIGTDNPNQELTVYGDNPNIRLTHTGSTNTMNALYTSVDGTGVEFNSYQDVTATRRPFIFKQYTTEVLRIDSAGKVGIGSAIPDVLLDVQGHAGGGAQHTIRSKSTAANASNFVRSESSDGLYIGLLKYGTGHSAYGALPAGGGAVYANSSVPITIMSDGGSGYINFATGGNTERLKITNTGDEDKIYVTDNDGYILDCEFGPTITNPVEMERTISLIEGVVEVGLFVGICDAVFVASPSGVDIMINPKGRLS